MNKLFRVLLLASFQLANTAHSQDAPISHDVSFPDGDAAWSVSFEEKKSKKDGNDLQSTTSPEEEKTIPGKLKKIEIIRKGELRRDVVTWADGATGEFWWPQKAPVVLWKKSGLPIQAMRTGYFESQRFDLTSFAWVNKRTYAGLKPLQGQPCHYYRMEIPTTEGDPVIYQAWIDPTTRRPAGFVIGEGAPGIFIFDQPLPVEPLVLNNAFSEMLARCEKALTPRKSFGR